MNSLDFVLGWGFCLVALFIGVTTLTGWCKKFKFMKPVNKATPDFRRGLGIVTSIMGVFALWFAVTSPPPSTRNKNWDRLYNSSVDSVEAIQISLNEPLTSENTGRSVTQPGKLKEILKCLTESKKTWPNHPNPIRQYYMRLDFEDTSTLLFRVKVTDNNGTLVYSDHLTTTRNDALGAMVDKLYEGEKEAKE